MKRMLVLLLTVCVGLSWAGTPIDVVNPSFEETNDGSVIVHAQDLDPLVLGWDTVALADPVDTGAWPASGMWVGGVWAGGDGVVVYGSSQYAAQQVLTETIEAGTTYTLSFIAKSEQNSTARIIFFYNNGANDVVISTTDISVPADASVYNSYSASFDTEPGQDCIGNNLGIRLGSPYAWTWVGFDAITVEKDPTPVYSPSPENGAADVEVDSGVLLDWVGNPLLLAGSTFDVYLSTNKALVDANDVSVRKEFDLAVSEYPAGVLDKDATYYWSVVTTEPNGVDTILHPGKTWSFDTELSIPVIDAQPENIYAAIGDVVEVTVGATDPLGGTLSYQWYQGVSPDTTSPIGTNSATLAGILGTDFAPGDVYCRVSNAAGDSDSQSAQIIEKAFIGYWELEGDPNDSSGNGLDGTVVGAPVQVTGKVGDALDFAPGEYVQLPVFERPDLFTVAAWIKTAELGEGEIFSWTHDTGEGATGGGALFRTVNGELEYGEWDGVTWNNVLTGGAGLADDQWHYAVITFDNTNVTNVKLYIDGLPVKSGFVNTNFKEAAQVSIGNLGDRTPLTSSFFGALDDVQLLNYAMTSTEIANNYAAIEGAICLTAITADISGPDDVPDCRVNLYDVAMLASQWLECNLYPECISLD